MYANRFRKQYFNRGQQARSANVWSRRLRPGSGFRQITNGYRSSRDGRPAPAGVRSGMGVTVQHDARQIYQRTRMPRRRRKQWKGFVRKVNAVSERSLGSRSVVFNTAQTFQNLTTGSQGLGYCALYSGRSSGDSFMNDLVNLSSYENIGNPTAAAGITIGDTTKWLFQSAILDVTFRNTSGVLSSSGTVITLDSIAKLEVDVYEIISSREWTDNGGDKFDVTSTLTYGASITPTIGNSGTALTLALRGVTPWEIPAALSYYRLKILKKTKYFVNNGDTFTYQVRDPKRHVLLQERMEQLATGNVPRLSRHILVIFKMVPGITVGGSDGNYVERISLGITRKYFYKIEGANEDRDKWVNG